MVIRFCRPDDRVNPALRAKNWRLAASRNSYTCLAAAILLDDDMFCRGEDPGSIRIKHQQLAALRRFLNKLGR